MGDTYEIYSQFDSPDKLDIQPEFTDFFGKIRYLGGAIALSRNERFDES